MKFGLFYETFVPPGDPAAEARILRELVDQIAIADRCGWSQIWLTEHHFLRSFSHMSAPEAIFGAAAYATERIRFGFGLALTPPAFNHPVRIAERVATLDCLSGGRVDMGSGRSTTPAELYGFGLDPDESRDQWDEGLQAVARLLSEEDVALDGKYVRMPSRTLGTFRGVSHKHLDRYLKEFTYRLNRRWNEDKLFYYLTRRAVEGKPLPYRRLIAEPIG